MRVESDESKYRLSLLATRKDCLEDISDIKFSPNSKMLAVGNHDNYIDIYSTNLVPQSYDTPPTCALKYLKRLRGHSSYLTHLDWSADNRLLKSNCGAYELLFWDVAEGKQLSDFEDTDCVWHTDTCVLGFPVMGIWPKAVSGTDISSADVSKSLNLVSL